MVMMLSVIAQKAFGQEAVPVPEVSAEDPASFVPSLLLEGVINGNFKTIDDALEAGESIDLVNSNGWSSARFAVANADLDMLSYLIGKEIDLNNPDIDGFTPLMVAASQVRGGSTEYSEH